MNENHQSDNVATIERETQRVEPAATASRRPRKRKYRSDAVYDNLLWRLQSQQEDATGKQSFAIGVTGCDDKSGATTIATNLAIRASDQCDGRVLLIEANWQSPRLRKALRLSSGPGVYEMILGSVPPRECVQRGPRENLDVIACGTLKRDLEDRINQEMVAATLEEVRQEGQEALRVRDRRRIPNEPVAEPGHLGGHGPGRRTDRDPDAGPRDLAASPPRGCRRRHRSDASVNTSRNLYRRIAERPACLVRKAAGG